MDMKTEATNDEILEYIHELLYSLGIKGEIEEKQKQKALEKFYNREIGDCVRIIRSWFGRLPRLRIRYVNDNPIVEKIRVGESPAVIWDSVKKEYLEELTKERRIRSINSVAAAVGIPKFMPLYGTREFLNQTLPMEVSKSTLLNPFEIFVCSIAHEMSHIVLFSVFSPLKNSEIATELLMMASGCAEFLVTCREKYDVQSGYLTDEQMYKAYSAIIYYRLK